MTDRLYRSFIQRQRSCLTGRYSEFVSGGGRCIAAHVRRSVDAGTGYKPEFSVVPMTFLEHAVQSNHGELACLMEFLPSSAVSELFDGLPYDDQVRRAKAFFDLQVETYYERWQESLKQRELQRV